MSAPRIIAGSLRGRRLVVPEGIEVRPTSERMREALFNILGAKIHFSRFLDVFAGSGAIGLEALSRGAAMVWFVENGRTALQALRANIDKLDSDRRTRVLPIDATRLGPAPMAFDIVYLDPPYASETAAPVISALAEGGWLALDATIVAERPSKGAMAVPAGFIMVGERRYGAGTLHFLQPSADRGEQ